MLKVYISGPITGIENYKEKFAEAEKELITQGYQVINPVTIGKSLEVKTYENFMRYALTELLQCDFIYMLDGWENSKGATLEYLCARACGLKFLTWL